MDYSEFDHMVLKWGKEVQEDYCYRKHSKRLGDYDEQVKACYVQLEQSLDYQHEIDADYTMLIIESFDYSGIDIVYK